MEGVGQRYVAEVRRCFSGVEDPRVVGRCDQTLLDVISIAILAVLCGADDWTEMEDFAESRREFLQTFLELKNGVPSHDTFQRVFERLDRTQFASALFAWTQALHEAALATKQGDSVIAIDGKSLRRSFSKRKSLGMLHLVTAWATEQHLTLAQVACEEKSNEITAIPELLRLLDVKGATITIDAMGCQKDIAAQIREQKGHYILQVKNNQPKLAEAATDLFQTCLEKDFAGVKHDVHESQDKGHGRVETRTVHAVALPADFPVLADWQDAQTLVVVTSTRQQKGAEPSWESRHYLTDHRPQAEFLGRAIRSHWSIENSQHWVLDVSFQEDSRRQQARNGATNFAALRRLAVSLLRQEKSHKRGAKNKRLKCALNPGYLLKVLANAQF